MVEFALVLPLLIALVFGIIEFGVFFYNRAMLTNAAREAAREGSLFRDPRLTQDELAAIVNSYCSSYMVTFGPPSAVTTVAEFDPQPLVSGGHLTVRVQYHYDFLIMPGFITDLVGGVDLRAATTMRAE
jgi:hypothetical protein